jgi:hypothetical protein
MAKGSVSKKGSSVGSNTGVDAEAFLEFLQEVSRGLGEIVRSFDEMVTQLILRIRNRDPASFADKVEINLEAVRKILIDTTNSNSILGGLRMRSNLPAADPSFESSHPEEDQEMLAVLRSQVLGAIPEEVWSEAINGFGDPDLANV